MKKLIGEYKSYLAESRSENTVQSYMSDLSKFLSDMNVTTKKSLVKIKTNSINEYIQSLKSLGVSYSSVLRSIASLRKFFGYCMDKGIIKADPTEEIQPPKAQRKLPVVMTDEEVIALLASPDKTTIKGMRDSAMLELMYATGARVGEIVNLKMGDISLKNEVVVLETGNKSRFVPVGKIAVAALYTYLRDCRPKMANDLSGDALFLNFYGEPLSRQGFWKIVKGYIEKHNLKVGITPHTLRHSFALHMLKNGADASAVSEMLGYSDVSSTKIYLDVLNNRIRDIYKKAHPRA